RNRKDAPAAGFGPPEGAAAARPGAAKTGTAEAGSTAAGAAPATPATATGANAAEARSAGSKTAGTPAERRAKPREETTKERPPSWASTIKIGRASCREREKNMEAARSVQSNKTRRGTE